ncbi:UDP-N-acetylmuramoyl-L-alanine--D-glutamate ligase [Ligilactobacillus sp. LYQ139]|uniref:UDP-N-acetylmuramoyl-L-alanine--D-glutamate ligase n=1 Tax=Ligilactobacillus sp. LYQ139 TaxID=3378800 RepID=UPI003853A532
MKKVSDYRNKNVLVLGLGKSGVSAAKLLIRLGANVTVNDRQTPKDLKEVAALERAGAKVITGSHPLSLLDKADLMVKNPGIPYNNPLVAAAVKRAIPVITEPELGYVVSEAPFISVTGTNGKTTTTTLITKMLDESLIGHAYSVGNIGVPVTQVAPQVTSDDYLVTELSSFQLMGIQQLHPHIAVITNIYTAHTDYHGSRENYVQAKMRIMMNQTQDDYLVINWDNPEWQEISAHTKAQVVPFSRENRIQTGTYEQNGDLYFRGERIMAASEIKVPGSHNVENALAAIAVAKLMNVDNSVIKHILTTFNGVRHRTQYVTTINDRIFYNDSKATNIEATLKALAGFKDHVVLLAGGLDRGFTFERLAPAMHNKVDTLIVFGETADLIATAGKQAQVPQIIHVNDAVAAVPVAYEHSQPGSTILLSPACASWDQWPTFEVRGDKYIEAIEQLKNEVV